jgi:hypothetical protein
MLEKGDSALFSHKKGRCGAVEKVAWRRLFKNIQMQGTRRLQERGVL